MQATAQSHKLISPDGQLLNQFSVAGHHQMLVQMFRWTPAGWQQYKGGWMWKGIARQRWTELRQQGWTKG